MKKPIRILSVEDSELDMELLQGTLIGAGMDVLFHRVDTAQQMQAALQAEPWDIILCDYAMPRFDPYSAVRLLKGMGLDIPFILISGTIGEENVVRLMKEGCHDCVMKHNLIRLPSVIEREMNEAQNRQENRWMRERLQKYEVLVQYSMDIMMFIDLEGCILEANEAAVRAYGYSREELAGMTLFNLLQTPGQSALENLFPGFHQQRTLYETIHCRRDGSCFPVEVSLQEGEIIGRNLLFCIVRDITERKQMENRLVTSKEKAEAANRAKSQFLANMSHEIRTPMNGIIGMTELALMTDLTDEQQEYLSTVKTSTHSLLGVLNDVLDYSKLEANRMVLRMDPFNIRVMVKAIMDLFLVSALQKNITLHCTIDDSVPLRVKGDEVRLKQVLSNIIGNAVKFTPRGGVVLNLHHQPEGDTHVRLFFSVLDTGIGISQDHLDLVFQSFFQVEDTHVRNYGGAGLGLAISKSIVELMNGEFSIKSQEGIGSEFSFSVLLENCDSDNYSVEKSATGAGKVSDSLEGFRVLLVEDDETSRMVGQMLLEKKGILVTLAEDGAEAVKKATEDEFDLILMDISIPVINGFEATGVIRMKEKKRTPIIALTAYALSGDRERCLEAGMDDYLSKPLVMGEFNSMLEKWLLKV